eukprot:1176786-Karenia_brevis.AAC.1
MWWSTALCAAHAYFGHESAKDLSRSVRRRIERCAHVEAITVDAISALNELYTQRNDWKISQPATKAQREAAVQLSCFAEWLGPCPENLTSQGAFQELLAKTDYSGEGQGSVVSIEVDSVALPAVGFQPAQIADIGGAHGRDLLDRLEKKILPQDIFEK